jgi:hypothetical protein
MDGVLPKAESYDLLADQIHNSSRPEYSSAHLSLEHARAAIAASTVRAEPLSSPVVIPFSTRAKRSFKHTADEAFLPAVSAKAATAIRTTIRQWRLASRNNQSLNEIAQFVNPVTRGWLNYYAASTGRSVFQVLRHLRSPGLRGCVGNTNGFDVGRVRPCTGWGALRDGTPRS